jgi:AcrR family transcriptional regulator
LSTRKDSTRRRLTAEQRREVIEREATEVFAERGYHGAAVEEIARRAGISVPVLYDHFPSKAELHRRLLERHFAELRAIWGRHFGDGDGGGDRGERLAAALDAWFAYVEGHPFAWRMLFRETSGDPAVAALHAQVAAASRAALLPLMAAEVGEDADAVEVEMAWEAVRGVIQTLALWWHDHREVPRERVVAAAMDALWVGMAAASRGERWRP